MIAPLSWLREYVDIDCTPQELEEKLFSCGFEVESLEEVGARVVFFEYRIRITRGKQAAADVRVRTDQQDALGRVADDLQPLVGVLGEMAVDLPAFVLGVHVSDDLFLLF